MATDGATCMVIETSENPRDPFEILIQNLASNDKVICKSQQKHEGDLTKDEKTNILTELLHQNKATFLFRFGQFLNSDELKLFEQFQYNPDIGYEIAYHLRHIQRENSSKCIKNRRYSAVKRLAKDDYFSEKEMRRRNPLLYDQLVGLYLSAKEKHMRDMQERTESTTLVGVLLDGIEKEEAENKRLRQEEAEDAAMEEEDSSSDTENEQLLGPSNNKTKVRESRTFWGEIQDSSEPVKRIRKPITDSQLSITAEERKLLKEEFYNTMCESFLDGKDDFDYSTIDNNEEYDNLELLNHDEEEKYFDAEEADEESKPHPNQTVSENETSEDELDLYMNSLNQHPAVVSHLTEAMKKL